MQGPDKDLSITAFVNDLGKLAKGVGTPMKTGNETIAFIYIKKTISQVGDIW